MACVLALTGGYTMGVTAPELPPGADNPLLQTWTEHFGLPPFDRIREDHFPEAFDIAMNAHRAEVEAIAKSPQPATFENTFEALDLAGEQLDQVRFVFFNLYSADSTPGIQTIAQDVLPKMSALYDDMLLNPALFARVKSVYDRRGTLGLTAEQLRLVEETHKQFIRSGAAVSLDKQPRLREINQELAVLGLQFGENLLKETNAFQLVVEEEKDLAGLPKALVDSSAAAAERAGMPGKWLFTLQAPSLWPFLANSKVRPLREKMLKAYENRGNNGNELDSKDSVIRQAALRSEKARLLGYPTWAHYMLEDRMAKTPEAVRELLDTLWVPALRTAVKEAEAFRKAIQDDGLDHMLEAWDWHYYAEQVRRTRYGVDDADLRPYFELDNVMKGAFEVSNRLFGLSFHEVKGVPMYHPEVRVFEVKDRDDSHLGVLVTDYHPRASKRGGAWCSSYRRQQIRQGRNIRPLMVNVGNFTHPTADTPALLSLDEVETLFHELGHALHGLMSNVTYGSLGGVPRDFVELPSQIMENWVLEPEVLKLYARHYQTGEVMPADLVAKVQAARKFNQGFATVEYLAASYLDLEWHLLEGAGVTDARSFERSSMDQIGLIPEIIPRYRSWYFQHIFGPGGGYSAGYYSYIWSEVLDSDAFAAFQDTDLFDPKTALAFRKEILEPAGSRDAMDMFKAFRGRTPTSRYLLINRGLTGRN
jgi:peptidyl-dipeptidase Dcp